MLNLEKIRESGDRMFFAAMKCNPDDALKAEIVQAKEELHVALSRLCNLPLAECAGCKKC